MPSKKQYNLVHNDEYDTRIPLYSEEAFHRGIVFHAKFIGSMEVSRPTSRVEIVTAMRKIRYEFKAKGTKKKKVTLEVSVDGLKVTLRKKKKKQHWNDDALSLMHHPIYRIFYVSHDSHDLKIFSYIARDGNGNTFRCNVFKSSKKSQAMRVVRTVGQAFEVCHKLSLNQATEDQDRVNEKDKDTGVESLQDDYEDHHDLAIDPPQQSPTSVHKDISLLDGSEENVDQTSVSCLLRSQDVPTMKTSSSPIRQSPSGTVTSDYGGLHSSSELTALKREVQLLRERLEQQFQQTRAAVAHARLLQEQLAAETATRVEAQARAHQLFVQNKDLLDHISALVEYRGQERMSDDHETPPMQLSSSMNMPQTPTVPDLSNLGQAQQIGNQSSPWEVDPSYPYSSYPDSIYVGTSNVSGVKGINNCSDQLYFQAQLLERLHNISPYQTQRSPYSVATPSTYPIAPGLLLPPMNKPSNPMQLSPGSTSLRVSQPSSFSSSPIMPQSEPFRYLEPSESTTESSFIKPLPCTRRKSVEREVKATISNNADEVPTVMLDAPSVTRQDYETASELANKQKILHSVLKTPGPPPSRTTSARLPPRRDVKTQMQRTTWARHTTK